MLWITWLLPCSYSKNRPVKQKIESRPSSYTFCGLINLSCIHSSWWQDISYSDKFKIGHQHFIETYFEIIINIMYFTWICIVFTEFCRPSLVSYFHVARILRSWLILWKFCLSLQLDRNKWRQLWMTSRIDGMMWLKRQQNERHACCFENKKYSVTQFTVQTVFFHFL